MPLVLLPSCTRLDVLNFLEHFCPLLLQSNHSAICTAWPPMHCAFAAPSIQCTHAPAMVCTRHMFSVRLACTHCTRILQSPLSIPFFQLHHGPSPWSPRFSRCIFPRCTESLSGRLPTCHRTGRGHRTHCLKRLWTRSLLSEVTQSIDEVTASETFASYATGNWDIPKQCDPLNASAVISHVGLSPVPSCAFLTVLRPATHAHPDAASLQRGVTCVDGCLCSTVLLVAHLRDTNAQAFTHEGGKLTA